MGIFSRKKVKESVQDNDALREKKKNEILIEIKKQYERLKKLLIKELGISEKEFYDLFGKWKRMYQYQLKVKRGVLIQLLRL